MTTSTPGRPTHAIEQIKNLTVGYAAFGPRSGKPMTVRQAVHDGDTITVQAEGNFGVRFLGIDTPEISFQLPGSNEFVSLSDPRWEAYLSDPFATPFDQPLAPGLLAYLRGRVGQRAAANHHEHAQSAEVELESAVTKDMGVLGQTAEDFLFFMAFAHEVMDRYGRLLGYINRYQRDPSLPEPRPLSYNERQLQTGRAMPYFIWPNIDPFRAQGSVLEAVLAPGTAQDVARTVPRLRDAREWVRQARVQKFGLYDPGNALRLEPFEVRLLARRMPPDRWVIDLSKNDDALIEPQGYYTIPNPEDRLFIPAEYVPLFRERGWR